MMLKKIIIFFFLVTLLGFIAYFLEHPFESRFTHDEISFYPQLKPESIHAIELESLLQGVRLEKNQDGTWMAKIKKTELQEKVDSQIIEEPNIKPEKQVKSKKAKKGKEIIKPEEKIEAIEEKGADPQKIEKAIATIKNLRKKEPVSTNPEKREQFQVGETAMKVRFFDDKGNEVLTLFIGKQGPNFQATYIRDEKSSEVYLVDEYLRGVFMPAVNFWGKKEATSEEPQPPQ